MIIHYVIMGGFILSLCEFKDNKYIVRYDLNKIADKINLEIENEYNLRHRIEKNK